MTETEIEATPSDVVMSFGVAGDVEPPAEDVPSPILAYSRFCPYGNVFRSREEYETWAADVDAVTSADENCHSKSTSAARLTSGFAS